MSHFVRCDRCDAIEYHITPNLTLPPGWTKVLNADLCERCSDIVRDFIRFKPGDAARLPIEPIPHQPAPEPSKNGEKLFETAPETEEPCATPADSNAVPMTDSPSVAAIGAPIPPAGMTRTNMATMTSTTNTETMAHHDDPESSVEERVRTREHKKRKLRGVEAVIPLPANEASDHEHTD